MIPVPKQFVLLFFLAIGLTSVGHGAWVLAEGGSLGDEGILGFGRRGANNVTVQTQMVLGGGLVGVSLFGVVAWFFGYLEDDDEA